MDGKRLEIEGCIYDLEDPEQRKAAVRAWLPSKSRTGTGVTGGEKAPAEGESPSRGDELREEGDASRCS